MLIAQLNGAPLASKTSEWWMAVEKKILKQQFRFD